MEGRRRRAWVRTPLSCDLEYISPVLQSPSWRQESARSWTLTTTTKEQGEEAISRVKTSWVRTVLRCSDSLTVIYRCRRRCCSNYRCRHVCRYTCVVDTMHGSTKHVPARSVLPWCGTTRSVGRYIRFKRPELPGDPDLSRRIRCGQ